MKNLFYRLSLLSISLLLSVSYGRAEEPAPTDLSAILKNVPAKCLNNSPFVQFPNPYLDLGSKPDFETQLYCAQTYFLFNGKPINPKVIKDLVPSNYYYNEDEVVSINLLNSQSAQYSSLDKDWGIVQKGNYFSVAATWPEESEMTSPEDSPTPSEYFTYSILGKTNDGIFVLRVLKEHEVVEEHENLTLVSCILFVRIREDEGFSFTTHSFNRKRILIETLGLFPLEDWSARNRVDRGSTSVTMDGNSLTIEKQLVEEILL